MLKKIIWTKPAQEDLANIFGYLAERDLDVAIKTIDSIEYSADWLQSFPWLGVEVSSNLVRKLLVPRTNLFLVYKIDADLVEIWSVFHTSQEFPGV
jgi:toxin ParE1/3/4